MRGDGYDYLDLADLLEVAAGVLPEVIVRDVGLLAAAAERPRTTMFGREVDVPGLARVLRAHLRSRR